MSSPVNETSGIAHYGFFCDIDGVSNGFWPAGENGGIAKCGIKIENLSAFDEIQRAPNQYYFITYYCDTLKVRRATKPNAEIKNGEVIYASFVAVHVPEVAKPAIPDLTEVPNF